MPRLGCFVLLGFLAFAETSCKKNAAAIPLPVTPAPVSTPAAPPSDPQPTPPDEPPKTAPPPAVMVKPPVRPAPQPVQPQPVTTPPPPATGAPVLGDVLPPEQQRQFNNAIDQNLGRAQSVLGSLGGKALNQEQQRIVAQIQNFIQQANTRRRSDLAAAKSLAERAAVLAQDLMKQFR